MKISFKKYIFRRVILGIGRIYQIACSILVVLAVPGALEYVFEKRER